MARLWTSGAEWNDIRGDGVTTSPTAIALGGATFSGTNPRTGSFAYRQTTNSAATVAFTGALGTTYYLRAYVYVSALPAAAQLILGLGDSGIPRTTLELQTDGTLFLKRGATQVGSASSAISAGSYTMLELALLAGTGTVDYVEGRLEGLSFASATNVSVSETAPGTVLFAYSNGTITTDTDDLALNDSSGGSQNSWPGSGKVVLLKPISLNANGGSWTDSAGATTSAGLTDSIDNLPPTGIADTTASANHQDRNAGANSSLDMNMTTYSTAGITAADTINVLQPLCNTGAPVVTAAKTGSLGISSNPVIANAAFVNGGTAAANFWSGVTAGTYPTGWKWEKGTTTYGSSVTVGSSPVARVTITGGTTTRIAMVDALGMYVDYTPATTKAPPFQARTARNMLLRR